MRVPVPLIALPTQFDPPGRRASPATPTCCCCCCCCIGTIVAVEVATPLHLRRVADAHGRSLWTAVACGLAALPLALLVGGLLGALTQALVPGTGAPPAVGVAVGLAAYGYFLWWAYHRAGLDSRHAMWPAVLIPVGGVVMFLVEFFLWAAVLLGLAS